MYMIKIILCLVIAILSTGWYAYLHKKTHISLTFLYKDNLLNIALCCCCVLFLCTLLPLWLVSILGCLAVFGFFGLLFLIRFYRIPMLRGRNVHSAEDQLLSPADGNIIYIKRVESGEVPCSVKNCRTATLHEVMQTGIMTGPVWMIGINMTPFDVHRNAAPLSGKIILNHHINGQFASLKDKNALGINERNSMVIDHNGKLVGVVQTASRLVRRIVSYKQEEDMLEKGEWFGMIQFGSQVDLIIPAEWEVNVKLGQQVYTKETIIATIR